MGAREDILPYFPERLRAGLSKIGAEEFERLTEIRLRAEKPVAAKMEGRELFIGAGGFTARREDALAASRGDIRAALEAMSRHSLYAFEEELRNGFITLPGGHRAGVCGQAVTERGVISTIKNYNSINLRISHEIKGCGENLLPYITEPSLKSALVISPPGGGKTTLIRDLARLLSDGGHTVGISDERSEIGGSYMGIPQNDVGIRTDVLDACPKSEGMLLLLRGMTPQVIVADEIGGKEDADAIEYISRCGVALICAAHGSCVAEAACKPFLSDLVAKRIFGLYILLGSRPGEAAILYDEEMRPL